MKNEKKALLSVVLLNYNASADCRTCLKYIKKQDYETLEIVVVDNASEPEDRSALQTLCEEEKVILLLNDKNSGFSAGNNIGLRKAAEHGAEYVLIINPDVQLRSRNYLSRLVSIMQNDESIAIAAGDMVGLSGDHQNPSRYFSYWEEVLWPIEKIKRKCVAQKKEACSWQHSGYCEKLSGGCLLMRMRFLQEIDFLDEGTFLYLEETILRHQVLQLGLHMYYSSDVEVLHAHEKLTGQVSLQQMKQLWKSQDYYLEKYKPYKGVKKWLLVLSWQLFRSMLTWKQNRSK